jgi:hypothetical protein
VTPEEVEAEVVSLEAEPDETDVLELGERVAEALVLPAVQRDWDAFGGVWEFWGGAE